MHRIATRPILLLLMLGAPIGPSTASAADAPKLKKAQIREVIHKHSRQFRACYERAAKSDPKLAGQLGVEITIGASGRVTAAKVLFSTLGRPAVDYCVVHSIRSWKFPKLQGGGQLVFVYPFLFQQKGGRPPIPERLTKALVSQGMRSALDLVRRCAARLKLTGTAKVHSTIGNDGRVSAATIEAPFAGTEGGACIEAAVKAARFPRFTGKPITFAYPFVLRR